MEKKYNHVEAYCLMTYSCCKCGFTEILWNSRDGVTPFMIGCPKCNGLMKHISFKDDERNETYIPEKGQRIFVDLTEERNRICMKQCVDNNWNRKPYPASEMYKSKEQMMNELCKDFKTGDPDIIVVE